MAENSLGCTAMAKSSLVFTDFGDLTRAIKGPIAKLVR
jgi:hypothetical protein